MTRRSGAGGGSNRPARGRRSAAGAHVDLRLAIPAAAGWTATAAAIGIRGAAASSAGVAATLAVVCAGIAVRSAVRARPRATPTGSPHAGPRIPRRRRARRADASAARCRRAAAALAVAGGVAAMLLGAAAAREPSRHPEVLEAAVHADGMVVADAVVDEPPAQVAARPGSGQGRADRVRIVAHLTALHIGRDAGGRTVDATLRLPAPVPVVVFASGVDEQHDGSAPARPGVGALMHVSAAVRAADPGDRAAYLLVARGAPEVAGGPAGALGFADGLRARLADAAADLRGPGAELLPGLAIGDVSAVTPALAQTMKDSSLTHLTAVSGANCAVIVGLVLALAAAAGLRRPARAVAALAALGAFVILVTPQPSVLRAAVMAAVLIVSTASGRPSRGLPALAVAVVVLLTGDPWLARDLGFALSVLATAGLLVLAPPLADRLSRRMPRRLAEALAIPVAAQVACQPVLLVLQPGLPVHGVLANVLAEPAAAPATIGGLVACVVLPVWPSAGGLVLRLAWLPASWIAAVASVMSRLPAGRVPWASGPAGVIALTVAIALVIAVVALGRPVSPRPRAAAVPGPGDVPPDG
ncbi:ComEC/Rec2 family competence protein [Clavibacter michiganensis]|nr:ComEC/Rec2 family competence protein [Clavibacter michiganensis subsp. michiganensis]UGY89243.1 ComEC/Rec2 family competence protein [Clavibacter michiganensis]MWJ06760.1 ComEC/Rec2 family competence protein [Clavibacter michiganensis subsp. michiganensis]MWJ88444.1 ComEC/Rec2 family competence protein [Clavibacter michiganensis subsp. michiganensis]OQJ66671.1 DNA transporter [Clavibacter michiganensis subsp. michiganensis]